MKRALDPIKPEVISKPRMAHPEAARSARRPGESVVVLLLGGSVPMDDVIPLNLPQNLGENTRTHRYLCRGASPRQ